MRLEVTKKPKYVVFTPDLAKKKKLRWMSGSGRPRQITSLQRDKVYEVLGCSPDGEWGYIQLRNEKGALEWYSAEHFQVFALNRAAMV